MKEIKTNHLIIKIFKDEKFAKNFIDKGEIHFETFKWFRDQAKNDIINGKEYYRGDPNEGFWFKKEMKFEDKYDGEFIVFQNEFHSLASFFTFDVTKYEQEAREFQLTTIKVKVIEDSMLQFGDHAVVILYPQVFFDRLSKVIDNKADADFVNYIPNFEFNKEYNCFTKLTERFSYQNEFRILNKNLNLDNNKNIHIGSLNDIAKHLDTTKMREVDFIFQ